MSSSMQPGLGSCLSTACLLSQILTDTMEMPLGWYCANVFLTAPRERRWPGRLQQSLSALCSYCRSLTCGQGTLFHLAYLWQRGLCRKCSRRQKAWVGFSFLRAKLFCLLDSQVGLQLGLSVCQHGATEHCCKCFPFLLSASL